MSSSRPLPSELAVAGGTSAAAGAACAPAPATAGAAAAVAAFAPACELASAAGIKQPASIMASGSALFAGGAVEGGEVGDASGGGGLLAWCIAACKKRNKGNSCATTLVPCNNNFWQSLDILL